MYTSASRGRTRRGRRARGRQGRRGRSADAVEPEGPHTEQGRKEAPAEGNVVPFPRDWLGPREELVPFGAGARPGGSADRDWAPGERGSSRASEREQGVFDFAPGPPPSAADFWGEDAAAIQHALQGPCGAAGAAPVEPAQGTLRGRARRSGRDPIGRRLGRAALPRRWGWRPEVRSRRVPGSRTVGLIAVGLVVSGGLAMTRAELSAAPGRQPARPVTVDHGALSAGVPRPDTRAVTAGTPHRRAPRRVRAGFRRPVRTAPHRAGTARAVAAQQSLQPGIYTPSAYTQPASAYTTPAWSSDSAPASAGAGARAGSPGSAPAGPVGPGAPFGPGHLG